MGLWLLPNKEALPFIIQQQLEEYSNSNLPPSDRPAASKAAFPVCLFFSLKQNHHFRLNNPLEKDGLWVQNLKTCELQQL